VEMSDSFEIHHATQAQTRGHHHKLYKPRCSSAARANFFSN